MHDLDSKTMEGLQRCQTAEHTLDGRNGSRGLAPGPPVVEGGKTCSSAVAKGAKTADVPHLVDDSIIITDHF